jgi:spore maturation protein CgeB
MLLSEYSEDMSSLYAAGKEADFFKSKQELIGKVKLYLENGHLRRQVAEGGYQRVIKDGHDIVSRMAKVVEQVGSK